MLIVVLLFLAKACTDDQSFVSCYGGPRLYSLLPDDRVEEIFAETEETEFCSSVKWHWHVAPRLLHATVQSSGLVQVLQDQREKILVGRGSSRYLEPMTAPNLGILVACMQEADFSRGISVVENCEKSFFFIIPH